MQEEHYSRIGSKLRISIENLYKHNEHILNQIEKGLREEEIKAPVVGYQGVAGSFGEEAAITYFASKASQFKAYEEFEDIFRALKEGSIDYGVVPIENSSAGEIVDIYDLMKTYELYIVGEQIIRIRHNLLGLKGTKLEEISEVYSHPQALSQSKEFLKEHKQMIPKAYVNTAMATQFVAEVKEKSKAAIGSRRAAQLYGLEILVKDIHFNQNNFTRFVILGKAMQIGEGCDKISIVFNTAHESGALYNILGHFAYNGLNLLKIHSRPLQDKTWEYFFFADLEGNLQDANVLIALGKVKEHTKYFKILGNYEQAN
ncbi:prephenate dehydratase [Sporanaerobium hydrogeniformans]|uniref:Prephenate dehydratase n=1 Tax=Sporanaerobium hydrogeniformans TaxID=3072179 RepID=A0AC61DD33_9FIRM|nr:prephenate dehydratase [Sporanaerobium hydrogeniformans]PHV70850.1 prephenate dehydratase [Sporanaerobium hydrogeniformans]